MDPATILADVTSVLSVANLAIQAAQDVTPFVEQAWELITTGGTLTDAQRATLVAQEAALTAQLAAPSIPADQP